MWPENVYGTENHLVHPVSNDPGCNDKTFADQVSKRLYSHIRKRSDLFAHPEPFQRDFGKLSKSEKQFWFDYASAIPGKLNSLGLFLRRFKDYCRTCIITEEEIASLVSKDLRSFGTGHGRKEMKLLLRELNFIIPACLKESGYEIIRQEEVTGVNFSMIRKIARIIHSRYLHEIRKQGQSSAAGQEVTVREFEDLDIEIQHSNIDNAAHIPTKLLSIGYRIRPVTKGFKALALHLDEEEIETMARVEHLRWSWEKRLNGWTYGKVKDEKNRTHPDLIPYNELGEAEKEKDRELVKLIPGILRDINYEAYPISPRQIRRLSYAIKPQSSIHKLLCETNLLGEEIRGLASSFPEIEEKIRSINSKIRQSIGEVQGSYNYASFIQKNFLPGDLFIRECFPDSFLLYEPKDVVSGDFYFFSRENNHIIFALADCTGHGIPASLISTIGYGILDQTVNILKITDPSGALRTLYSGVHRFLRRDPGENSLSDDMDIILCNLDTTTGILTWSGVGNILFRVTDGRIMEIRSATGNRETSSSGALDFKNDSIQLRADDALYICSDGFADQFGGARHKKYGRRRLADFLLHISDLPMPRQGDKLYEEFEKWREENDEDQTDDITVIGIRI
ncbi:hypothetical protein EG827_02875 [bacterium]|nr:hypothetical protein [bacterium]